MGLGNALMVVAVKERFADRPAARHRRLRERHPARRGARDGARGAAGRRRRFVARADARLLARGRRLARLVARGHARRRRRARSAGARTSRCASPSPGSSWRSSRPRPASTTAMPPGCPTRSPSAAGRTRTRAELVFAINLFAILSVGRRDARRRPLRLVAPRAADCRPASSSPPARSASRSTRRTRWSGHACSASATAPSSR